MIECAWPAASFGGQLREKEVHIWCANLEPAAEYLADLEQTLSAAEAKRAGRFRFWRHRRRYIAGRGILRLMIGHYLGVPPADVVISYSKYSKPLLPDKKVQFNLSHSQETALYAFCLTADVGVDLEKIRPIADAEGIAERFFSPSEYNRFQAVPVEERNDAFFACWTRKEAFIKAVGEGLSYPLSDFDVAFSPGKEAKLNSIGGSEKAAANWSLYALAPVPNFAAAMAIKGQKWEVVCCQFAPIS